MILRHLDKINLLSLPALLSLFSAAQYFSLIPCFSVEGRIRPLLLAHSKGQDWTADDRCAAASGCTLPWPVHPQLRRVQRRTPAECPARWGVRNCTAPGTTAPGCSQHWVNAALLLLAPLSRLCGTGL